MDTGSADTPEPGLDPGMDRGVQPTPEPSENLAGIPTTASGPSVEVEDYAEVERALDPVLILRDGTKISVPKIETKRVIKIFRLAAAVVDETAELSLRLVDYADLMDEFTNAVGNERLTDLEIDEFMDVFSDFFAILVRKLGKRKRNRKAVVKAPR